MQLPFTHDQFLDVFAAYNSAFWWAAILLWLWTLLVAFRWLRNPEGTNRLVGWLLVVHWTWSGAIYHLGYFRSVNSPALLFGLLFILEAVLFAWLAYGGKRLEFASVTGFWRAVGGILVGYSLVYPAVGLAFGLAYPRMPTFGVPCPTVVLTVGFLLASNLSVARWIAVIPLIWTFIGGSAAFLLGVRADLVLALSGLVLLARLLTSFGGSRKAHA